MTEAIEVTPQGWKIAAELIGAHWERRGLSFGTSMGVTQAQVLQILVCWGCLMLEKQNEVWLAAQMDRILGLEKSDDR